MRPRLSRLGVAAPVLLAGGLFRAAQNAAQSTSPLQAQDRLHLSPAAIGALVAFAAALSVLANATIAARVPTARTRLAAAAGAVLLTGSLLLLAVPGGVLEFGCAMALLGLGGGIALPSLASVIAAQPGVRRDRALARYSLVLSAALAVGPLVESGVLTRTHGSLPTAFLAFAAVAAGCALVLLAAAGRAPAGRAAAPAPVGSRAERRYRDLLAIPGWRLAVLVQLFYALPFVAFVSFGALIGRALYGAGPAPVQLAFTVFFATSFLARAALSWLGTTDRERPLVLLTVLLTCLGIAALAAGGPFGVMLFAAAVLGVPHGVSFPLSLSLVAHSVPAELLAAGNGLLFSASGAAGVLAPGALGVLAAVSGYRIMVVLLLVPVALFSVLLRRELRRELSRAAPAGPVGTDLPRCPV